MRQGVVKRLGGHGAGREHCQVVRRVTTPEPRDGTFWVTSLVGSYMPISTKSVVVCGCLVAVTVLSMGCSPRRIPPMSVSDLMEDRVLLDGVLMKCNRDPAK